MSTSPTIAMTPATRERAWEVVVYDTPEQAAEAGWDDALPLPPFLDSAWLRAFAPVAAGGAGGPSTRYVQLLDGVGRPRLQCLHQVLPVAGMRLGERVSPRWAAKVLGDEAHQIGQALFSGLASATDLAAASAAAAITRLAHALDVRGTCFLKDVPALDVPSDWTPIESLPEMRLGISSQWRDFEDYLSALPAKYRRRARRARRKFEGLSMRPLDEREVARFGESLSRLYAELVARTPYAPYVVPEGYVTRLKLLRPGAVTVLGYFDGARMVGFATLLRDGPEALAHLAAVEPAYNASHQLYLNLLFDLLAEAIARACAVLNYGRTATTIKSSVGAVPLTYASAVRHSGCVRNGLLRRLVPLIVDPAEERALVQRPLS